MTLLMWMVLTAFVVAAVSVAAAGGLLIVRRTQLLRRHLGENDVAGILFGAVGVLYGALLAFVVFATWEGYSRAEQAVTTEAADLVAVYRDTQQFPTPLRQDIQGALRTYANQVMATEWESHGNLPVHTTPDLLNPVWDLYRQVDPLTPRGETQLAVANERLHALELQRHLRHLSGEATLPLVFWPVLSVGGVIVVLFSYAFHQNKLPFQAGMTALLAGLLTLVILLIFSLNMPFTGPVAASQQPLRHALAQFDAIDLSAPSPPPPTSAPVQQTTAAPAQPTLVPTKSPPTTAVSIPESTQNLVSQTWTWVNSGDNSGKVTVVPAPENYTLTLFGADGKVAIKADCNSASGSFTADDHNLTITVGPMTKAACPPGSLSDQFITELGEVASYLFDGEQLILEWKMDTGRMAFGPAGTQAPSGSDAAWERIQASKKIVVGTAADYPPFEYYRPDLKLDGFDIALTQRIGEKLGLQIEFNDFAFEGLGSVLQLGQADVAAAAASVTPERLAFVDFSSSYYVSSDAVLAPSDATLTVKTAADLADKKVGVQKGTVFEAWANENIAFNSGSGGGIFTYQNADEMINALRAKQLDAVLLGKQSALSFEQGGGVKVVGQDFTRQEYALALPKNSPTLQAKINEALNSLVNDGTLLMLTKLYLNDEVAAVKPLPPMTPVLPTTPAACVDGMAFVQDLSYDDQNLTAPPTVQPGQAFVKSWRIKNVGTCIWTPAYQLAFTYGNTEQAAMGGAPVPLTKNVNPGETYDLNLNPVAPKDPGTYSAVWNLHNAQDVAFGESLWVAVTVPGQAVTPIKPATTLDFDVKLISCKNNPSTEKPGGVILTLQFQPTGGTTPYRYFDIDEGQETLQTYEREGSRGSATIVAFSVLSADGQGKEKKIQFPPSTFSPAGCQ